MTLTERLQQAERERQIAAPLEAEIHRLREELFKRSGVLEVPFTLTDEQRRGFAEKWHGRVVDLREPSRVR